LSTAISVDTVSALVSAVRSWAAISGAYAASNANEKTQLQTNLGRLHRMDDVGKSIAIL
jgi:hypothetical protein